MTDRTTTIRELNDRFRATLQGGKVLVTQGVQALGPETVAEVIGVVRRYSEFTTANDPYNQHDFGSFEVTGRILYWKIDCYDLDLRYHSLDAADPTQTIRVLTIMLAEEY